MNRTDVQVGNGQRLKIRAKEAGGNWGGTMELREPRVFKGQKVTERRHVRVHWG